MLFYNVTNDIAGFQNRLGMFTLVVCGGFVLTLYVFFSGFFFFTLALFGFSCLSSLGLFANERILFMRERYVVSLLRSTAGY